jgi:hypothetical protein
MAAPERQLLPAPNLARWVSRGSIAGVAVIEEEVPAGILFQRFFHGPTKGAVIFRWRPSAIAQTNCLVQWLHNCSSASSDKGTSFSSDLL